MARFRIKPKIDPRQAADMFGTPLAAGDFVLCAASLYGTSSCLRISRIIDVKYKRGVGATAQNVPQNMAERWTLWTEPWVTLAARRETFESASYSGDYVPIKQPYARGVTIQPDHPVLRLDASAVQQYLRDHAERVS